MSLVFRYSLFLLILVGLSAALLLVRGQVFISMHIGDTLHSLEAALRMADGEVPHFDFMTPIGILGFAPISWFLSLGFGPGISLILSNILVAILLIPATVWVGLTRFEGVAKWGFGAVIMLFALSMIYGGSGFQTSFAMHYNRWSWALSFLLLVTVLLPAKTRANSDLGDALVIGVTLSVLAMLKMTFFLAFGGASLLILLLGKRFRVIVYIAAIGGLAVGIVTLKFGIAYWFAYADDLLFVATESLRSYPDRSLAMVVSGPDRIVSVLVLLASVILLRGGPNKDQGLGLMILMPAFIYIAFQNFGNEPKWLIVLGFCVFACRPNERDFRVFGIDARAVSNAILIASFAILTPALLSMTASIAGASSVNVNTSKPLPFYEMQRDIWVWSSAANARIVTRSLLSTETEAAALTENYQFVGDTQLPTCELFAGYFGHVAALAEFVENNPILDGEQVLVADQLSDYWLYTPIERLKGGAPWYYGGDGGFENARFYLVPACARDLQTRGESLKVLKATGWKLELVISDRDYYLFEIIR